MAYGTVSEGVARYKHPAIARCPHARHLRGAHIQINIQINCWTRTGACCCVLHQRQGKQVQRHLNGGVSTRPAHGQWSAHAQHMVSTSILGSRLTASSISMSATSMAGAADTKRPCSGSFGVLFTVLGSMKYLKKRTNTMTHSVRIHSVVVIHGNACPFWHI